MAEPFPPEWEQSLAENIAYDSQIPARFRPEWRRLTQVFVAEKNWEGCGGLILTEEMKVSIAAQACLLVVGRAHAGRQDVYFDHVLSVLVYPSGYLAQESETTHAGVVIEGKEHRLGEAWWRGPVVLSWEDALAGGRRQFPGSNLVFHEFAHQLDMLNGHIIDGTPPLDSPEQLEQWTECMQRGYDRLVADCRNGRPTFLDCYGATDPGEFFAVLTEAFFSRPRQLRRQRPALYAALLDYYLLDPAEWVDGHHGVGEQPA